MIGFKVWNLLQSLKVLVADCLAYMYRNIYTAHLQQQPKIVSPELSGVSRWPTIFG